MALAFVGIVVLGGANFVAVRLSNRELDPFWGAASRFIGAAFILAWIVAARRIPFPRGRALVGAMLYGGLGIGASYALAYWGLTQISAGLGSVIGATTPLITLFLAVGQGQERFRVNTVLGSLIAVFGVALIVRESLSGRISLPHLAAVVGMALAIAQSGIVAKRFPASHPAAFNVIGMTTGSILLLACAAIAGESLAFPVERTTQLAWVYLVVSSCALFTLFLFVIKHWTASATNYTLVLMPIVAITLSTVIAKEPMPGTFLLQAALVLLGTWIGIRKPHPTPPSPLPSATPASLPSPAPVPATTPVPASAATPAPVVVTVSQAATAKPEADAPSREGNAAPAPPPERG